MSKNSNYCRGFIYKRVPRTKFSDQQQDMLSEIFDKNPYPDMSTKRIISRNTGLEIEQIRVWFQNKRARMRFNLQKEAVTSNPITVDCASANKNDEKGRIARGNLTSLPLETHSCSSIVDILQYCRDALSGELLHNHPIWEKF